MAPEQIRHQPCAASDQYAPGVMVYEWLCGEPPFPGPGMAVFGQHLQQPPPSLCARLPHLPRAVEDGGGECWLKTQHNASSLCRTSPPCWRKPASYSLCVARAEKDHTSSKCSLPCLLDPF